MRELYRLTIVLTLYILLPLIQCRINRRNYYTGIIFEGDMGMSPFLDFSDPDITRDEWKDLNAMTKKHNLTGKSTFCSVGPGGWVSYPQPSYTHNGTTYQLIVGNLCTPARLMQSVQALGYIFGNQEVTLSLFTKPYFQSKAKLLFNGTASGDFKSIITLGYFGATLEAAGAKGKVKYCLVRSLDDGMVCLIADVAATFGLKSGQVTVKTGCDFEKDKELKLFYIQNCFPQGVHDVRHEIDLLTPKVTEVCKHSGAPDPKNVASMMFAQVVDTWKSRVLYESESFGVQHLKNLDTYPKVEAFFQFLDIFMIGCPSVSNHYLSLLGHVFLNHIKAVWNSHPEMVGPVYDSEYADTFDYLSHCWAAVNDNHDDIMAHTSCHARPFSLEGHSEDEAMEVEALLNDDTLDEVIEQVWLILNFVVPICDRRGGYRSNVWMGFPKMFKDVYLKPLESQWMKPGIWERIYRMMFHGYDINQMHGRILACTQTALSLESHLKIVKRTSGFGRMDETANSTKEGHKESDQPEGESETTEHGHGHGHGATEALDPDATPTEPTASEDITIGPISPDGEGIDIDPVSAAEEHKEGDLTPSPDETGEARKKRMSKNKSKGRKIKKKTHKRGTKSGGHHKKSHKKQRSQSLKPKSQKTHT